MPLLEVDFRPSLTYLLDAEDRYRTVAVGGLLLLFAVFVVPLFLVAGYHLRVLRRSMVGDESPPAFEWWRDLAADGLRASVVVFVYFLGLYVAIGVFMYPTGIGADASPMGDGGILSKAAVPTFLGLSGIVELWVFYVLPAAIAATAERTAVRAGFGLRGLWSVVNSWAYLRAWLAAAVALVGTVTAAAVVAVSGVGALVAPFLLFYGTTVAWHLFGRGLRDLRDANDAEASPPDRIVSLPESLRGRVAGVFGVVAGVLGGVAAIFGSIADAVGALLPTGAVASRRSGNSTDCDRNDGSSDGVGNRWDAATVGALAERPPETLDAADVDTLVAALDADDPETVATAARTLGEVAGARPDLIADSGATPPLRDLRLADDPRVGEAATRAIRRFSEAGLY